VRRPLPLPDFQTPLRSSNAIYSSADKFKSLYLHSTSKREAKNDTEPDGCVALEKNLNFRQNSLKKVYAIRGRS
jgi:hypothetical protein